MASSSTVVKQLQNLHLFRNVSAKDLTKLTQMCQILEFRPRQVIFAQNAPADHAMILVSGKLDVCIMTGQTERHLGNILPGEIFGESGLFHSGGTRSAMVRARDPRPRSPRVLAGSRPTRRCASRRRSPRSRSRTAPSPSGSACAPATPSGASPLPGSLGFFFAPSKASFAAAQTDPVRGRSHYRASDGSASSHFVGRRRVGRSESTILARRSSDPSAPTPLMRRVPTARLSRLHRRPTLASRTRD